MHLTLPLLVTHSCLPVTPDILAPKQHSVLLYWVYQAYVQSQHRTKLFYFLFSHFYASLFSLSKHPMSGTFFDRTHCKDCSNTLTQSAITCPSVNGSRCFEDLLYLFQKQHYSNQRKRSSDPQEKLPPHWNVSWPLFSYWSIAGLVVVMVHNKMPPVETETLVSTL